MSTLCNTQVKCYIQLFLFTNNQITLTKISQTCSHKSRCSSKGKIKSNKRRFRKIKTITRNLKVQTLKHPPDQNQCSPRHCLHPLSMSDQQTETPDHYRSHLHSLRRTNTEQQLSVRCIYNSFTLTEHFLRITPISDIGTAI